MKVLRAVHSFLFFFNECSQSVVIFMVSAMKYAYNCLSKQEDFCGSRCEPENWCFLVSLDIAYKEEECFSYTVN